MSVTNYTEGPAALFTSAGLALFIKDTMEETLLSSPEEGRVGNLLSPASVISKGLSLAILVYTLPFFTYISLLFHSLCLAKNFREDKSTFLTSITSFFKKNGVNPKQAQVCFITLEIVTLIFSKYIAFLLVIMTSKTTRELLNKFTHEMTLLGNLNTRIPVKRAHELFLE